MFDMILALLKRQRTFQALLEHARVVGVACILRTCPCGYFVLDANGLMRRPFIVSQQRFEIFLSLGF